MLNQFIDSLDKMEMFATGLLLGLTVAGVVLGYVAEKLENIVGGKEK